MSLLRRQNCYRRNSVCKHDVSGKIDFFHALGMVSEAAKKQLSSQPYRGQIKLGLLAVDKHIDLCTENNGNAAGVRQHGGYFAALWLFGVISGQSSAWLT